MMQTSASTNSLNNAGAATPARGFNHNRSRSSTATSIFGVQLPQNGSILPVIVPSTAGGGVRVCSNGEGQISVMPFSGKSSEHSLSRTATLVEERGGEGGEKGRSYSSKTSESEDEFGCRLGETAATWRRWAKRHSRLLLRAYYALFVILLVTPSVMTPLLVGTALQARINGTDSPFPAYDRILSISGTLVTVVNTLLTLGMRGLDLIECPWSQNLLTGIGVVATVTAIRNSVQLNAIPAPQ